MSVAILPESTGDLQVRLRPLGRRYEVLADSKEQAIHLRSELAKRAMVCTFPVPTWKRTEHAFYASPSHGNPTELEKMLSEIEGVQLMSADGKEVQLQ